MPMRRLPGFPPPPLTTPYKCEACGAINWLLPAEIPAKVKCVQCGTVGKLKKESLIEHFWPEL